MRALFAALALIPLAARADDTVSRGEYLARAADCVACHSAGSQPAYSGGRAFATPFGTIFSTNITPDTATGIGNYTDDEWLHALQQGVGRDGKHLYPAMPYTSYTKMSREDALAIKAYLFTLKPVHVEAPANALHFPFNLRAGIRLWNALNLDDHRFAPDPSRPAEWNRGAYLTEALGHCGECHTPRGMTFGLKRDQAFAGAVQQGWLAYNISGDPKHGIGAWSEADLVSYLGTGTAPHHGPASGPMAEAVENSLRYLSAADLHAIAVYLKSLPARDAGPEVPSPDVKPAPDGGLGRKIYVEACQGCHLATGEGRQSSYAALAGDHSAADPEGTNLLRILAQGSEMKTTQGLVFMHGFTQSYSDAELAALANYVIGTFGGRPGHVTPDDLRKIRKTTGAS